MSVNNNKPVATDSLVRIHENMLSDFDSAIQKTDGRKMLFWQVGDDPEKRKQLEDMRMQAHEMIMQLMQTMAKGSQLNT